MQQVKAFLVFFLGFLGSAVFVVNLILLFELPRSLEDKDRYFHHKSQSLLREYGSAKRLKAGLYLHVLLGVLFVLAGFCIHARLFRFNLGIAKWIGLSTLVLGIALCGWCLACLCCLKKGFFSPEPNDGQNLKFRLEAWIVFGTVVAIAGSVLWR